jgi:hypothetical protein
MLQSRGHSTLHPSQQTVKSAAKAYDDDSRLSDQTETVICLFQTELRIESSASFALLMFWSFHTTSTASLPNLYPGSHRWRLSFFAVSLGCLYPRGLPLALDSAMARLCFQRCSLRGCCHMCSLTWIRSFLDWVRLPRRYQMVQCLIGQLGQFDTSCA